MLILAQVAWCWAQQERGIAEVSGHGQWLITSSPAVAADGS